MRTSRDLLAALIAFNTVSRESNLALIEFVRAYLATREVFCFGTLWKQIEALDNRVADAVQTAMINQLRGLTIRATVDPDLQAAAESAAGAIAFNQGEVCTAGSRLLVERSIKDKFLPLVIEALKTWKPGNPLDPSTTVGALVDTQQMNTVLSYIESGHSDGAKLVAGGKRILEETGGTYVEPTIFDGVSNAMKIAQEEIFGPVLSVITFDSAEEAVAIANDTPYGLAAAVWTQDISKAHLTAKALRAGSVWVNQYDGGDMTAPFGGFKQSGNGRDKSLHAFDKYTELKATWIKL